MTPLTVFELVKEQAKANARTKYTSYPVITNTGAWRNRILDITRHETVPTERRISVHQLNGSSLSFAPNHQLELYSLDSGWTGSYQGQAVMFVAGTLVAPGTTPAADKPKRKFMMTIIGFDKQTTTVQGVLEVEDS